MEKVQLHVWIPADVKTAAQDWAEDRGVSLAAAVNLLLRQALQGSEQS